MKVFDKYKQNKFDFALTLIKMTLGITKEEKM